VIRYPRTDSALGAVRLNSSNQLSRQFLVLSERLLDVQSFLVERSRLIAYSFSKTDFLRSPALQNCQLQLIGLESRGQTIGRELLWILDLDGSELSLYGEQRTLGFCNFLVLSIQSTSNRSRGGVALLMSISYRCLP